MGSIGIKVRVDVRQKNLIFEKKFNIKAHFHFFLNLKGQRSKVKVKGQGHRSN